MDNESRHQEKDILCKPILPALRFGIPAFHVDTDGKGWYKADTETGDDVVNHCEYKLIAWRWWRNSGEGFVHR
jgi:hypothetical protein